MKFVITERVPCTQVWTYEVEANSETEALEVVLKGEAKMVESSIDEADYENAQYEIEDEEGNVFDVEREDDNDIQDNDEDEYDGGSWDMQSK
jgi:hypothetical protein